MAEYKTAMREPNHGLRAWRKVRKQALAKKKAEQDRYDELCGPVVVTSINDKSKTNSR